MHVNVFDFSKLLAQSSERYLEFVRVSAFSVGIYVLDGGAMGSLDLRGLCLACFGRPLIA
jgi:hypothetical protein